MMDDYTVKNLQKSDNKMMIYCLLTFTFSYVCNHDKEFANIKHVYQNSDDPEINSVEEGQIFPYPDRKPPRIVFNFSELSVSTALNPDKICTKKGDVVKTDVCSEDDVLTEAKSNVIRETMNNLKVYLQNCLKVTPMTAPIELETESNGYKLAETGAKAPDTDMYYTVLPRPYSPQEANVLASATAIKFENVVHEGRPIQGLVYINLAKVPEKSQDINSYPNEFFITCFHEICHALGISNQTYQKWINITTRKPYFNQYSKIMHIEKKAFWILYTPEVHKYAVKRYGIENQKFDDGEVPTGVELEDGGGEGTKGSHPEIRVYYGESMVGVSSAHSVISDLVFAMLKDTGWYDVNYTYAKGHSWGNGNSINGKPIEGFSNGAPQKYFPKHYLCKINKSEACTYDYTGIGECVTDSFNCDAGSTDPFCLSPTFYNYYNQSTRGHSSVHDWIKYIIPYNNRNCLDVDTFEKVDGSKEEAGPTSRCFEYPSGKFGCFRTRCDGLKLYVKYDKYEFECTKKDEKVGPIWQKILCPDPELICRGFAVAQNLPEDPFGQNELDFVHMTTPLGKKFPLSDTWIVVLIAAGVALILIVCIVACCIKRRKMKSRVYAMEDSEEEDKPKKKKKKVKKSKKDKKESSKDSTPKKEKKSSKEKKSKKKADAP